MAAVQTRNPLLDRRGFNGPKSPFPLASPRILADKTFKQEVDRSSNAGTPGRLRALSDPPPSSESKLLRSNSGRSNFDLEPNPFEQSFSNSPNPSSVRSTARDPNAEPKAAPTQRRARSQSPSGIRTPGGSNLAQKLPPLSSIASPQVTGSVLHHFGWNMDHTLRSGPLSPAMLHGPTPGSVGFSSFAHLFDPSSFRTGLTPSVTGQPTTAATFAPPSPATQALFAMMTNNPDTPNAHGSTSTATMPHTLATSAALPGFRSERDLPNHFDLGFRNVLEGKPAVGDPLHADAVTASMSMAPMFATQPAPKPIGIVPAQPSPLKNGISHNVHPPLPYLPPGAVHPAQVSGFQGGQNPLYLLTQAQQEMNNEDDHIAAGVLSNLNASNYPPGMSPEPASAILPPQPYTNGIQHSSPIAAIPAVPLPSPATSSAPNTRKRKVAHVPTVIDEEVPIPPPAPRGRRKGTGKKQKMNSDDDDDDDAGPRKPETEEEKRKNFLERNRQAALKCRQRKKAWLANLQAKVEYLTADNETLQTTVQALREEISSLRTLLIAHKDCPAHTANGMSTAAGVNTVGDFLAVSQRSLPERPQPPPQTQFT